MKKKDAEMAKVLMPVENEMRNLLDMFEFFLTERHLGKPIEVLGEIVKDMRIIVGRILIDHFLKLKTAEEEKFCQALADMLADRSAGLPIDGGEESQYYDYCIGEMLTAFEYAEEIKREFADDPILQKILALDIPILRPFDYGMKGKLKIVTPPNLKKFHG